MYPPQQPAAHTLPAAAEPLRVPPRSRGDGLRSCGRLVCTTEVGERVSEGSSSSGREIFPGWACWQSPHCLIVSITFVAAFGAGVAAGAASSAAATLTRGMEDLQKSKGFQQLMPWRSLRLIDHNPLKPFAPRAGMCWHRASAGLLEHLHFGVLLDAQATG